GGRRAAARSGAGSARRRARAARPAGRAGPTGDGGGPRPEAPSASCPHRFLPGRAPAFAWPPTSPREPVSERVGLPPLPIDRTAGTVEPLVVDRPNVMRVGAGPHHPFG